MERPSRRQFLATALTTLATGIAGCGGPVGSATTPTETETGPTASPTEGDSPSGSTSTDGTPTRATPTEKPSTEKTPTETTPTEKTPTKTAPTKTAPTIDAVGLEPVASGFDGPLDVAFAPDADRRYVVEQGGLIHVHGPDGVREDPFLDLREAIDPGREKGLLGLALHPGFADNRRVFVRYSAPSREDTPSNYSHTFVLAEFRATEDGLGVRRDSERTLLEIPEPQANHNAGNLAFGPDGYLYVPVGDGGFAGDRGTGHVEDWYDGNPGGNGQDVTENLLGSVLRIDVDGRDDGKPYAIPEDNPLVGRTGLDEHYAWGFRNPWGIAFDRGTFIVADVGQDAWEEVNVVRKGGNYGWNVKEGRHCYGASDCPDSLPEDVRGGEPLIDPVTEYPHSGGAVSGISVIGGHVYRGSAIPELDGRYVFGDLLPRGRLFVATPGGDRWPTRAVEIATNSDRLAQLRAFGRDADGEVYAVGTGGGEGWLHRIVPTQ